MRFLKEHLQYDKHVIPKLVPIDCLVLDVCLCVCVWVCLCVCVCVYACATGGDTFNTAYEPSTFGKGSVSNGTSRFDNVRIHLVSSNWSQVDSSKKRGTYTHTSKPKPFLYLRVGE